MGKTVVQSWRTRLAGNRGLMLFWSKVTMQGCALPKFNPRLGRCWLWKGSLNQDGYGRFQENGVRRGAHRHAYELLVGPIPNGKELDHLCRVRNCVRPRHLKAKTRIEHIHAEGSKALESLRKSNPHTHKTKCPQGHRYIKENTYVRSYRGGEHRSCKICCRIRSSKYYRRRGRKLRELRRLGR